VSTSQDRERPHLAPRVPGPSATRSRIHTEIASPTITLIRAYCTPYLLRHWWRPKVPASPTKNRPFSIGSGPQPRGRIAGVWFPAMDYRASGAAGPTASYNHEALGHETGMRFVTEERSDTGAIPESI